MYLIYLIHQSSHGQPLAPQLKGSKASVLEVPGESRHFATHRLHTSSRVEVQLLSQITTMELMHNFLIYENAPSI